MKLKFGSYFLISLFILIISTFSLLLPKGKTIADVSGEMDEFLYLPLVLKNYCPFEEQEPNGRFSEAIGPIHSMVSNPGCFSSGYDIDDLYFFELTNANQIKVSLTNISPNQNYDLAIFKENDDINKPPGIDERLGYSENPGNIDEEIILDIMPPRRYYVQVHNKSKTTSTQPYKLFVNYGVVEFCDGPAITGEIFRQLKSVPGQFPFFSKNQSFQCIVDRETKYNGALSLHFKYTAGNEDGYWGVATPSGYDASRFGQICLRAYTEKISPQSFTINLQDTTGKEIPSPIQNLDKVNKWELFCVSLKHYKDNDKDNEISLENLKNVNVHFNNATKDADVYIDNFEFLIKCNHPSVIEDVFYQLKGEPNQYSFYAENSSFDCLVDYERKHDGLLSLHLQYQATTGEAGYFGIVTPNGYQANSFSNICLRAFAETGHQTFKIELRDTAENVASSSPQNIIIVNSWQRYCAPLSNFNGVSKEALKSVVVLFNENGGNVNIWVDDFEFE